eukprot:CAMPEP_0172531776 /NCGR_PEP_ID=MMETSP1067-20121228/5039_1 /TAXON_ID=265564 ORGANISM="Thalassiosira punctigera, Strain Tpunct2005C2" /NCGR_SAMPLE_ID=MMETSP1067 /ASSEMBLY_ACC=CAM_ASM_000444 /LENGTH=332 /DNA_ID=CAMNT_0013316191 /DNA_START=22 /DNA_END=1020 /DNA_ORIENTATION=-
MILRSLLAPLAFVAASLVALPFLVAADSGRGETVAVKLDEDLYNRALAHAAIMQQSQPIDDITDRLRNGDAEALYEVAKSMNDSGDKISSVLIWHALADDGSEGDDYERYDSEEGYDYAGHVPSAMALGFSYRDVDGARSLHYFLMATSAKGKPHQAAMYNAGRLYLELEDPSAALAYIRACATLDREHPGFARPQLSISCKKAYETLSNELVEYGDVGLEEAVECFPYAHLDDFPKQGSKEYNEFHKAMEHLEGYAAQAARARRPGEVMTGAALNRAKDHLSSATEALANFRSSHREQMSRLQIYLVGYVMDRIKNLSAKLEGGGNGSDEL